MDVADSYDVDGLDVHGVDYAYDLENFPLHIRLLETEPDEDKLIYIVARSTADGAPLFLILHLSSNASHYRVPACTSDWVSMKGAISREGDGVWIVNETDTSLLVFYEGVEVIEMVYKEYGTDCQELLNRNTAWISFGVVGTTVIIQYKPHRRGSCIPLFPACVMI